MLDTGMSRLGGCVTELDEDGWRKGRKGCDEMRWRGGVREIETPANTLAAFHSHCQVSGGAFCDDCCASGTLG